MGMEDFNLDDEEPKPLDREGFDLDDNLEQPADAPIAEESGNRVFLIIAAALGGIALIALVCIAVYALVLWPRAQAAQTSARATLEAQNTEVAVIIASTSTSAAETAMAAQATPTPTQTVLPPTETATASPTPVVAVPSATQPAPANNAENATATALHSTLQANATLYAATLTAKPLQPTAIPNTGFADEVGLPMMLGIAVLLVLVIFLARRMRTN